MKPNATAGQGNNEDNAPDLFTRALAHPDVQVFMQAFPGSRIVTVERLPDRAQAQQMLAAFASVGANSFDVTLLDIEGKEQGFQAGRSLFDLKNTITRRLKAAAETQSSIVIRPRSTTALLIQLDDFSDEQAAQLAPFALLTLKTSPGNGQVWLAVSDGPKDGTEAAKVFKTRVRRGAKADHSATGATRIAGSINFKAKYAPDFPVVTLGHVNPSRTVTVAALEQAGLIAPLEPQPPASVPRHVAPEPRLSNSAHWPDWQRALSGAPPKRDGSGPDRSMADFMFAKWSAQRGHHAEAIAEKLLEVSTKARERAEQGDKGYALLTARNAVKAYERDRERSRHRTAGGGALNERGP